MTAVERPDEIEALEDAVRVLLDDVAAAERVRMSAARWRLVSAALICTVLIYAALVFVVGVSSVLARVTP